MHSQKNHNEEIIKEKITSFPPFEKNASQQSLKKLKLHLSKNLIMCYIAKAFFQTWLKNVS